MKEKLKNVYSGQHNTRRPNSCSAQLLGFFHELCQDGDLCFGFPISVGLSFLLTIENAKVSQILPITIHKYNT